MNRQRSVPKTVPPASIAPGSIQGRVWLFRVLAIFGGIGVFFGLLELGLRIAGVGDEVSFLVRDPAGREGVLVENHRFSRRYFSEKLVRVPQTVSFTRVKPAGTMRIFVFGESAAEGDPAPAFGFARILQVLLEARHQDRPVEVINTAVTAINSHVIRPIAAECAGYGGDVWVVYMGNNEVVGPFGSGTVFGPQSPALPMIRANIAVRSTRTGQWMADLLDQAGSGKKPTEWGGMEMFLGQQVALGDSRTSAVYDHFETNLREIVDAGLESGAKVVLSTVGSNVRDCPPFASLHRVGLTASELGEWQQHWAAGVSFQAAGNWEAAVRAFEMARSIDGSHAELHFRMALCLTQLDRWDEASQHFVQARDHDTLRFRCDSGLNQRVRVVASEMNERGVWLADAEAALRNAAPNGIPGEESFFEHVHLTFLGNYRVAVELARQVELALGQSGDAAFLPADDCAARLALTASARADMAGEMLRRVGRPPFTGQLGHEEALARREKGVAALEEAAQNDLANSQELCRQGLLQRPDDWRIRDHLAGLLLIGKEPSRAAEQWKEVVRLVPHRIQTYDLMGTVLLEAGRFEEALVVYGDAARIRPNWIEAQIGSGRALSGMGRHLEAVEHLRRAAGKDSDRVRSKNHLGVALVAAGKGTEAESVFREILAFAPDFEPARLNLASVLQGSGRTDEAMGLYRRLLQENPSNTSARLDLARALSRLGRWADAVAQYEEGTRIAPDLFEMRNGLGAALIRLQRTAVAAEHFEAAIRLRPDAFEPRLNLGTIWARQGRRSEAKAQFEEVLRLRPGLVPAHLNLAAVCLELGLRDEALRHAEEAVRLEPNNPRALALRASASAVQSGR